MDKNWYIYIYRKNSATENRTPVSRVTGGDTSHYTIADCDKSSQKIIYVIMLLSDMICDVR